VLAAVQGVLIEVLEARNLERSGQAGQHGEKELAEMRRKNRQLGMENEILKRAAAYFARESVLPK
jgi:transposase-like protein